MESVNINVQRRNPMISIAKAIGIILMVIGHVFDKESWGIHFIYMFHMPLFFVLSGYFFKEPRSATELFKLAKKKILGLYVPYLSWTILFILVHNLLLNFEIGENVYSSTTIVHCIAKSALTFVTTEKVLVGFWFLKALFSAILFLALFSFATRRIQNNIYQKVICLLCLVSLLFIFKFPNKTLLGMIYGAVFLCFGRIFRDLGFEHKIHGVIWMVLLGISVFLISRCFNDVTNTEMLFIDKNTFLPFTFSGCVGSVWVMLISKYMGKNLNRKLVDFIRYIGDHTLIIFVLHYPLIKIFDFYFKNNLGAYTTILHMSGG